MAKLNDSETSNGTLLRDDEKLLIENNYKVRVLNKDNELVELNNAKNANDKPEFKRLLTTDYEDMYKTTALTDATSCGYGIFRNSFLQK